MPTLLQKIFKPKWQSPRPEVRAEALAQMQWDDPESREILLGRIRLDTDAAVRLAALRRIGHPKAWLELLTSKDEILARRASDYLQESGTRAPETWISLFDHATSESDLKALLSLPESLWGEQALDAWQKKVSELPAETVAGWILNLPQHAFRHRLAGCAWPLPLIESLNRQSKGKDKKIYQMTKNTLQTYRAQVRDREQRRSRLIELLEQLEILARTEPVPLYSEKLAAVGRELSGLDDVMDAPLRQQVSVALEACRQRESAFLAAEAAEQQRQKESAEEKQELDAIWQTLQAVQRQISEQPMEDRASAAALDALIKTQRNRLEVLAEPQMVNRPQATRIESKLDELEHYRSAVMNYCALEAGWQAQAEQDEVFRDSLAQQVNWPDNFPRPEPLRKLAQHLTPPARTKDRKDTGLAQPDREARQAAQTKAETLLTRLDQEIREGKVRESGKLLRELQGLESMLGDREAKKLSQRLNLEQQRLNELKDWAGYAARPRQEALIAKMQQLAERHIEPREKASQIQALQNEWKRLGGTSDQTLWDTFKQAADRAFEPCRAYFSEESQLKEANLAKRQEMVRQLEDYLQSTDWSQPDWSAADRINRQARQEWRTYFPVDARKARPVQKTFNALLGQLDSHLDKERERNHAEKQAIVREAEALAEEPDTRKATQGAKDLQKKWQSIGITNPKTDRLLWKAFRAACDQIFGQLKQEKEAEQVADEKQKQRASELLEALHACLENPEEAGLSIIQAYQEEFDKLQLRGTEGQTLSRKFSQAVRDFNKQLTQKQTQQQIEGWKHFFDTAVSHRSGQDTGPLDDFDEPYRSWLTALTAGKAAPAQSYSSRELTLLLEILAGIESPADDQSLRMALQVQRLATGMQNSNEAPPIEKGQELAKSWLGHPSLTPESLQAEAPRVWAAIKVVLERYL